MKGKCAGLHFRVRVPLCVQTDHACAPFHNQEVDIDLLLGTRKQVGGRAGGEARRCGRRYVKFDTFHPAVDKGLPVTRVVSRVTLQAILAEACARLAGNVIQNNVHIVDYEEKARRAPRAVQS